MVLMESIFTTVILTCLIDPDTICQTKKIVLNTGRLTELKVEKNTELPTIT